MKRQYLVLFVWMLIAESVVGKTLNNAPARDKVIGRVLSQDNKPLAGASAYIAGTTNGTSTDTNGNFTLSGIPKGEFKLTVSFVGYESFLTNISDTYNGDTIVFKLTPKPNQLQVISVSGYDNNGWEKYDQLFKENFIGTSSYSASCKILNPDALQFVYSEIRNELIARTDTPLIIQNNALGYIIEIDLVNFNYNFLKNTCVFDMYPLFKEMQGDEQDKKRWARNRQQAYYGSMMHFMRSLYNRDFASEGFEVRRIETKKYREKERIKTIYQNWYAENSDELMGRGLDLRAIEKKFESSFPKDTIRYYKEIVRQKNEDDKILHSELLSFNDIAAAKDSSSVFLDFKDYLQITYTKQFEPIEYAISTGHLVSSVSSRVNPNSRPETYPTTMVYLTEGIPVKVYSNGHSNNVDMYLEKYWAWWEKLATRLPYNYIP